MTLLDIPAHELFVSACKPSETCERCRRGLKRYHETSRDEVSGKSVIHFTHNDAGIVACEDQTDPRAGVF